MFSCSLYHQSLATSCSLYIITKMLFKASVVVGTLAVAAQAVDSLQAATVEQNGGVLSVLKRQTHICKPVTAPVTCERSCGAGYVQCVLPLRCYNPGLGQTCCSNGSKFISNSFSGPMFSCLHFNQSTAPRAHTARTEVAAPRAQLSRSAVPPRLSPSSHPLSPPTLQRPPPPSLLPPRPRRKPSLSPSPSQPKLRPKLRPRPRPLLSLPELVCLLTPSSPLELVARALLLEPTLPSPAPLLPSRPTTLPARSRVLPWPLALVPLVCLSPCCKWGCR